ncbi:hypothetical protein MASR2M18_10270 [Ignavibacteria bacterium]
MSRVTVAVICWIFCAYPLFAQHSDDTNDPQIRISKGIPPPDYAGTPHDVSGMCHNFFRRIIAGEPDIAFEKILTASPLGNKKAQSEKRLITFNKAIEVYGAVRGFEFTGSESASESLVKVRFITLHEQYPLRWFFTFYKSPSNGWIVINMAFDDDVEYLFPKN